MTPHLFQADKDDTGVLAVLHRTSFPDFWTAQAITDLLATPGTFAFVATDGFILARAAGGEAEILTLAVVPQARRRGLGRALVGAAAAHAVSLGARRMFLEVSTANAAALALYKGADFREAGHRKGYYDGQDALILSRVLCGDGQSH